MNASSSVRVLCFGVALGALCSPGVSQLEYGGSPCPEDLLGAVEAPSLQFAALNVEQLLAEDDARPKGSYRFGVIRSTDLGLRNGGVWQTLPNGDRLWRLRVASEGAFSLGPEFAEFELPPGALLFVYNDAREIVRGAYTAANNKPNGQFAIQPTAGDAITLEYLEPAAVAGRGRLQLSGVVHDYRDFVGHGVGLGHGPDGGSCNVDVNCAAGNPWRNQIDSVIGVTQGGWICTASLINNTANDGRQLVMSANHCGSYTNAVFLFNYQRSGCRSGPSPRNESVQGSTLLATGRTGDYRLVELQEQIPASYSPYYNGWNRGSAVPADTFCVHHPSGCPKKISFDNDPPARSGQYWRVRDWDVGTTEGGSSGSPLMDPNGRFIGQLCCGLAACGNNFSDDYGALNTYWSNVSRFLDPLGTGATAIDGFDPDPLCTATVQAAAIARNGSGINPAVFSQANPALIGRAWASSVDLSGFPGSHTFLMLASGADPGTPVGGPFVGELLCRSPVVASPLGVGQHSVLVPADCSLAGASFCAQALILVGRTRTFTNALDVTVGTF
ncbi:MAG: hypothetical protein AAF628_29260 [Planctomycetota bacterium]